MDLKLFLDPVSDEYIDDSLSASSFQKSIFVNHTVMYDLDGIDIVILGIDEGRGLKRPSHIAGSANEVRRELYKLSKPFGSCRVLDLGNLRNGPTEDESARRLAEVIVHLLNKNVLPIILGGSNDMAFGQYAGYESEDRLVSLLNIDARFDLDDRNDPARSFLSKIFKYEPNFLFNYIHMGYQSYFVDEKALSMMERLYFETYRLGEVKEKFKEYEPVIRDADLVTFDISSIKSAYCPEAVDPNVFGFSGEEACQLTWYAGLNDKLSSIGFYNLNIDPNNSDNKTASVVATMIWYFIEGYYHRKGDRNFMSSDYLVYEVSLGIEPESIRFYKSKLSEKWWMEVPDENSDSIFLRNKMVPCNYADYEIALKGEVPQRWINALSKMS
ncbi:MAG: formimidoylglutamase [Cyclobacteriaceae bacterium]